jgi:ketosteroid isomerase-like protein
MNRNALLVALSIVMSIVALGSAACEPSSPGTNREAKKSATPTVVKEAVNTAAIEAEVLKLEKDWADAGKNYDVEAVRRIVSDDVMMTYPDGSTGTKADELRIVESKAITLDSWEMFDPKVTVIDADNAFITGRSVIKNGKYKDPSAKKPVDISGEYRFTDIYARHNGQWQAIASHTTKIVNPTPTPSPSPSPKPAKTLPTPPAATASPTSK